MSISEFVSQRNREKVIFTPGPASLLEENVVGLAAAFGRGDSDYLEAEQEVLAHLEILSGQEETIRLQGSGSLAIEIMILNFLFGKVVVVETGFYSDRLVSMVNYAKLQKAPITEISTVSWEDYESIEGRADWIFACPVETSKALKIPIESLRSTADRMGAKLMLDATASIGLERNHELADAIAYSSCKGLFGLTGAAFVSYSDVQKNYVSSFYLDLENHVNRKMTGPYHTVLSLLEVLKNHDDILHSVSTNKERCLRTFSDYIVYPSHLQPQLCTGLRGKLSTKDPRVVLYEPRGDSKHSVLCHLGEAHLGRFALGDILELVSLQNAVDTKFP